MNDHPTESLSAYIDQELDEEERIRIDGHLLQCSTCRELLADLMDMSGQVADFYGRLEAPPDLELKVMAAVGRKPATSRLVRPRMAAVPFIGLVALIVLGLFYGATFFKLFSIALQFSLTAAYVASHVASSIPAVWGTVLAVCAGIFVISGLSLRRILRSAAQ